MKVGKKKLRMSSGEIRTFRSEAARDRFERVAQAVKHGAKIKKSDLLFVVMEKSLNNEHFSIDRADDCVWLTERGKKKRIIHLTKDQAKEVGGELKSISKVKPFARTRKGHFERVKGWFMPSKKVIYPATDKGFYDSIKTHLGLERYGEIIKDTSKATPDMMQAVNDAYLQVTNELSAGGIKKEGLNLRDFMLKDKKGLQGFLSKVFKHVSDDIISFRKDLRRAIGNEKRMGRSI